jgi:hypothetical protein
MSIRPLFYFKKPSGSVPGPAFSKGNTLIAGPLRHIYKAILFAVLWDGSASYAEPYSHFGFCVAPTPPACAHSVVEKQRENCARIIKSYTILVFTYRACLSAEMDRAVREANETLRGLKCSRHDTCDRPFELGKPVEGGPLSPRREEK